MSSFEYSASIKNDKNPITRKEIVRRITAQHERENLISNFRTVKTNTRWAVAKRDGKAFRIIGVEKQIRVKTFAGLKETAKKLGFTHIRFGAIKTVLN